MQKCVILRTTYFFVMLCLFNQCSMFQLKNDFIHNAVIKCAFATHLNVFLSSSEHARKFIIYAVC